MSRAFSRLSEFMPHPPESRPTMGVHSHPGFHTAASFNTACAYATYRVTDHDHDSLHQEDEDGPHYVTDYPVVVELDMRGFVAKADYDADAMMSGGLADVINDAARDNDWSHDGTPDDKILDDLRSWIESWEEPSDESDDIRERLFGAAFNVSGTTGLRRLMDAEPAMAVRLARLAAQVPEGRVLGARSIPDDILIAATGQYRYTEPVGEDRIVRVHYVKPIAQDVWIDDGEHDGDELEERWPGFTIWSEEDYDPDFDSKVVWTAPRRSKRVARGERLEFHGTTLDRFRKAAPHVAAKLPPPPTPPFRAPR